LQGEVQGEVQARVGPPTGDRMSLQHCHNATKKEKKKKNTLRQQKLLRPYCTYRISAPFHLIPFAS
jgi:hypothetical protein